MPFGIPKGAMCVQRFDDSLEFCNSHYLSHFAAFFIDARTKRSVVESFALILIIDLDIVHMIYSEFKWLAVGGHGPEDALRRSSGGPEGRVRRSNRGSVNTGLGGRAVGDPNSLMILPQVHLRKPCYDFYFL
jgi:hypothetical protein